MLCFDHSDRKNGSTDSGLYTLETEIVKGQHKYVYTYRRHKHCEWSTPACPASALRSCPELCRIPCTMVDHWFRGEGGREGERGEGGGGRVREREWGEGRGRESKEGERGGGEGERK